MGYRTYTCSVHRDCGGCSLLTRPYPLQLARKQEEVAELFAGFPEARIEPIIGMEEPLHFRNKILTPFASGKKGRIIHGLYRKHSHQVIAHDDCLVVDERAQPILDAIANLMPSFKMRPYDEDRREGLLRHVLIRTSRSTGEVMVTLVCARSRFPSQKTFVKVLRERCPEISTVVLNVNGRVTNVVLGEEEHVLFGRGWISDELLGYRFRISSQSFFQTNPSQTEKLYAAAIEAAGLDGTQTVLDTYCGIGTIGIIASGRAAEVVGVERNGRAVRDARSNARANKVGNIRFVEADATDFMRTAAAEGGSADVVFLDPPRAGATPEFLSSLTALAPEHVVYISCNPKTQVRDVAMLRERGWRLTGVQPVDMFPHTPHIETVASITRG